MISRSPSRPGRRQVAPLGGTLAGEAGGRPALARSLPPRDRSRRTGAGVSLSIPSRRGAGAEDRAQPTLRRPAPRMARARILLVDGGAHRGPSRRPPHVILARGAPFPQLRVMRARAGVPTVSGASALLRDFRPAALPTPTARRRGRLGLIATVRQEVFGVSRDPDVGQKRFQVHLSRGHGRQHRTHIRQRFDPMALGPGQDAETDRRCLTALVTPDK